MSRDLAWAIAGAVVVAVILGIGLAPTCPSGSSVPWSAACGAEPASDLGICTHHLFTIFPEGRSNAS